ncbi:MAG: SDR family oxidoreductase [Bacteroidales bacterium]|nr:SDR family oxidoreductase [Bacteroidales bacterium]
MYKFDGEWALITGASSGIGYEMAKILAAQGINLVLVSRNEERLCEVARELNKISDVIIMPVDLSVTGSATVLFNECERLGLSVNILINNAGFGIFGESLEQDTRDVESMLTLNMTTLTTLSNLFGRKMKEQGKGHILNVASTAAYLPIPYLSAYASSKSYVRNFSQALYEEMRMHNVKVTCLLPGPTHTNFFDVAFKEKKDDFLKWQYVMPAHTVAQQGLKGLFKGRREVIPGTVNKLVSFFAGMIPVSAVSSLIRRNFRLHIAS